MFKSATYIFTSGIVIFVLLMGSVALAQETDTLTIEIENKQEPQSFDIESNLDRSMNGGSMTEMGTYSVPAKSQYYDAPFEAQESLDRAVEAYRKELENNWYWQFLKAVSPYIRLHLGVSDFETFTPVDRENPLFRSFNSNEKRQ